VPTRPATPHHHGAQHTRLIRLPDPEAGAVEYHVETLLTPAADQRLLVFTAA
jgi:hypothetical protein